MANYKLKIAGAEYYSKEVLEHYIEFLTSFFDSEFLENTDKFFSIPMFKQVIKQEYFKQLVFHYGLNGNVPMTYTEMLPYLNITLETMLNREELIISQLLKTSQQYFISDCEIGDLVCSSSMYSKLNAVGLANYEKVIELSFEDGLNILGAENIEELAHLRECMNKPFQDLKNYGIETKVSRKARSYSYEMRCTRLFSNLCEFKTYCMLCKVGITKQVQLKSVTVQELNNLNFANDMIDDFLQMQNLILKYDCISKAIFHK